MTTFTSRGVPMAEGSDAADIAARVNPVAQLVHDRPGVSPLTTAQRDALAGSDLWDGRLIFNTTLDQLERYDAAATDWVVVTGEWETWIPTYSSENGALTSVTTDHARREIVGKTCTFTIRCTITNAGTGAGTLRITNMPPAAQEQSFSGRDHTSGPMLQAYVIGAVLSIVRYDNATTIATGKTLSVTGSYEIA